MWNTCISRVLFLPHYMRKPALSYSPLTAAALPLWTKLLTVCLVTAACNMENTLLSLLIIIPIIIWDTFKHLDTSVVSWCCISQSIIRHLNEKVTWINVLVTSVSDICNTTVVKITTTTTTKPTCISNQAECLFKCRLGDEDITPLSVMKWSQ